MDKAWHGQIPQKPRVLYVLLSPYMCVQLCMLKPLSGTWEASWLFSSFDSKRKWLEILILLTKISKYRSTQCAIPEDQLNIHDKLQVYRLKDEHSYCLYCSQWWPDGYQTSQWASFHLIYTYTHKTGATTWSSQIWPTFYSPTIPFVLPAAPSFRKRERNGGGG